MCGGGGGGGGGCNIGMFGILYTLLSQYKTDEYTIRSHIGGIGNYVIAANMKFDTLNYETFVHRPRAWNKIVDMMEKHGLLDVWREYYPENRRVHFGENLTQQNKGAWKISLSRETLW